MNADVANKWIAALRSGAYAQTTGQLRKCGANWEQEPSDSAFCCLGVLCDVYAQEHADVKWGEQLTTCRIDRGELFMNEEFHLPREVREWAGMSSDNGKLPSEEHVIRLDLHNARDYAVYGDNLVDLNDNGCLFTEIANVIAKHVEVL